MAAQIVVKKMSGEIVSVKDATDEELIETSKKWQEEGRCVVAEGTLGVEGQRLVMIEDWWTERSFELDKIMGN